MNFLAELSGMEPHKISFRVGLAMKNVHTFFDYVFRSRTMDKEVAKRLSGWENKFDGDIYGGYPPTLKSIKTEKEKLHEFVSCLFGVNEDTKDEKRISKPVCDLLAASLFRYYRELRTFISNEPEGNYTGTKVNNHEFIYIIESLKDTLKISEETFSAWINEVRDGFDEMNYWALQTCDNDLDRKVSPKPIIDEVRNQTSLCKQIVHGQQSLKREVSDFKETCSASSKRMRNLEEKNDMLMEKVEDLSKQLTYATAIVKDLAQAVGVSSLRSPESSKEVVTFGRGEIFVQIYVF